MAYGKKLKQFSEYVEEEQERKKLQDCILSFTTYLILVK